MAEGIGGLGRAESLGSLAAVLLFKALLDVAGFVVVPTLFAPYTLTLAPDPVKGLESYVLLVALVAALPRRINRLSELFLWSLVLLIQVPMLAVFWLSGEAREWAYATSAFWVAVGLINGAGIRLGSIPVLREGQTILAIILVSGAMVVLAHVGLITIRAGLRISFNLAAVYETRAIFQKAAASGAAYAFNWGAFVLLPLAMAWGLTRRHWTALTAAVVGQMALFWASGNKIYLFAPVIVVSICLGLPRGKVTPRMLASGLALAVGLASVSFLVVNDAWMSALLTNRLLLLPAVISYNHFDFFSAHPFALLAHSVFSGVLPSPYERPVPQVIGEVYFANPENWANSGMLGDAFMNFGLTGVVLLVPAVVGLLVVIDALAKGKDVRLAAATAAMPVLFLVNGGCLSSVLTGGLGLALVILFLLPPTRGGDGEAQWGRPADA